MVLTEKPLEHFTYDLASIQGMKSVDVKISNVGNEYTAPYKQLVVTVTVKTNEITLQVPIHVAVNSSLPVPPPLKEVDDADKQALAELSRRITGRGKIQPIHLLFLQKLYKSQPNTTIAEATRRLLEEFKGLQITKSGVRYHLVKNLDITFDSVAKPMDTTEEFFDTQETVTETMEMSIPGVDQKEQIQAQHSNFLRELYKRYPAMPATQARDILCSQYSEMNVSVQTVRDHLNTLGIDISRKKEQQQQKPSEPPAITDTTGNKFLPEHVQFLQQLYKVDPDLPAEEARVLLCIQFEGLDIPTSDIQDHLKDMVPESIKKEETRDAEEESVKQNKTVTEDDDEEQRKILASKLQGTGKITVDHLLFLQKLYKKNPKTTASMARNLLCEQFTDLDITTSGVRYHLVKKLGVQF